MYLVIDTETTGLFDFSKPADAEGQPRLANLAMIVLDARLREDAQWNFFIKPDGWKMTPEAQKVHGLTDEYLTEHGLPVNDVLETYVGLIKQGAIVAAFNAQYDTKVMRGALRRAGMPDLFETTPNICVMRALTNICQIPKASGRGFKFPKLSEACAHFGIPQERQHSAMGDVIVTAELLRKLASLDALPASEVHYAKNPPEKGGA